MRAEQVHTKVQRYTLADFQIQFPDEESCLAHILKMRYPDGLTCEKCAQKDRFYPVAGRRAYACYCGHQVYPTARTIFHKSVTPLRTWLYAMYSMGASKNGIVARELQRHIRVTYKTAWRMCHQIRLLMNEEVPI